MTSAASGSPGQVPQISLTQVNNDLHVEGTGKAGVFKTTYQGRTYTIVTALDLASLNNNNVLKKAIEVMVKVLVESPDIKSVRTTFENKTVSEENHKMEFQTSRDLTKWHEIHDITNLTGDQEIDAIRNLSHGIHQAHFKPNVTQSNPNAKQPSPSIPSGTKTTPSAKPSIPGNKSLPQSTKSTQLPVPAPRIHGTKGDEFNSENDVYKFLDEEGDSSSLRSGFKQDGDSKLFGDNDSFHRPLSSYGGNEGDNLSVDSRNDDNETDSPSKLPERESRDIDADSLFDGNITDSRRSSQVEDEDNEDNDFFRPAHDVEDVDNDKNEGYLLVGSKGSGSPDSGMGDDESNHDGNVDSFTPKHDNHVNEELPDLSIDNIVIDGEINNYVDYIPVDVPIEAGFSSIKLEQQHEKQLENEFAGIEEQEYSSKHLSKKDVSLSGTLFSDVYTKSAGQYELAKENGIKLDAAYYEIGENMTFSCVATHAPRKETGSGYFKMLKESRAKIAVSFVSNTDVNNRRKMHLLKIWEAPDPLGTFTGDDGKEYEYRRSSKSKLILNSNKKSVGTEYTLELWEKGKAKKEANGDIAYFHYSDWPDHNVPASEDDLLCFAKRVDLAIGPYSAKAKEKPPVVINCVAGAGRTGTFIPVMNFIRSVGSAKEDFNVKEQVEHLRKGKTQMVQTLVQYKFIHKCISFVKSKGKSKFS